MLRDILNFASRTLVVGGRLSMWMPTASDEDIELEIPTHPNLEVVSVCVQPFNNCQYITVVYTVASCRTNSLSSVQGRGDLSHTAGYRRGSSLRINSYAKDRITRMELVLMILTRSGER